MLISILIIVPVVAFAIGWSLATYNANCLFPKELFKEARKDYLKRSFIYQASGVFLYYVLFCFDKNSLSLENLIFVLILLVLLTNIIIFFLTNGSFQMPEWVWYILFIISFPIGLSIINEPWKKE